VPQGHRLHEAAQYYQKTVDVIDDGLPLIEEAIKTLP
jgi:hypothetical protein